MKNVLSLSGGSKFFIPYFIYLCAQSFFIQKSSFLALLWNLNE